MVARPLQRPIVHPGSHGLTFQDDNRGGGEPTPSAQRTAARRRGHRRGQGPSPRRRGHRPEAIRRAREAR